MSQVSDEQSQPEAKRSSAGALLKQAREAKGLSTEAIANKLHLRPQNIEDIEADIIDKKVSLTFYKGYLKLYAKHVEISEDRVLEAFLAANSQLSEPAKLQSFSKRVSKQANDDRLMLFTYLIGVVVIALVVVWWLQRSEQFSIGSTINSEPTESIALVTEEVEANDQASSPQSLNEQTNTLANDAAESVELISNPPQSTPQLSEQEESGQDRLAQDVAEPTSPDAIIEQAGSGLAEQVIDAEPELSVPGSQADFIVQTADATGQIQETANEALAELSDNGQSIAAMSEQREQTDISFDDADRIELIFEFADDCWMNLSDATGEAIAYGVKKSGRVMPVSGVPPFQVILGAPEVVQISYNGDPIDMSRFRPGRTARFSLPFSS